MKHKIIPLILAALATIALPACEDDKTIINPDPGKPSTKPDATATELASLHSTYHNNTTVVLHQYNNDEDAFQDEIYIELAKPASEDMTFKIDVDEAFEKMSAYEITSMFESGFKLKSPNVLETERWRYFISIDNDGIVVIPKGERISSKININIPKQEDQYESVYALPLIAKYENEDYNCRTYYLLENLNFKWNDRSDKTYTQIVYVDTESVNPLIVQGIQSFLNYLPKKGQTENVFQNTPAIDIVCLRKAYVNYNPDTKQVSLAQTSDMSHVLKNSDKYIKPLQRDDFKVLLTIEGGGKGVGFANITNEQAVTLANQIKVTIDMFGLDGVNLRDEFVNYEKEGSPAINDNSYTIFIKLLRELMPDKMITVADDGVTSLSLCDEHENIRAGELIDYAWSTKWMTIENPYSESSPRKPIIGLPKDKYCCIPMTAKAIDATTSNNFVEAGRNAILKEGAAKIFVQDAMLTNDYGDEDARYRALGGTISMLYEKKKVTQYPRYSGGVKVATNFVDNGFYYGFKKDW